MPGVMEVRGKRLWKWRSVRITTWISTLTLLLWTPKRDMRN